MVQAELGCAVRELNTGTSRDLHHCVLSVKNLWAAKLGERFERCMMVLPDPVPQKLTLGSICLRSHKVGMTICEKVCNKIQ